MLSGVHGPPISLGLLITAMGASACGDSEVVDKPATLLLAGEATLQAYRAMSAAPAEPWDWSAGVPETPAEGAIVPSSQPPEFAWSSDLVHLGAPAADAVPVTGVAFLLRFSSPSDPTLLDVLTTLLRYTPDPETFRLLAEAAQPITLAIDSADFESNQVVAGRGPFYGMTRTFTVRSTPE